MHAIAAHTPDGASPGQGGSKPGGGKRERAARLAPPSPIGGQVVLYREF